MNPSLPAMSEEPGVPDYFPERFEVSLCPFAGRARSICLNGDQLVCKVSLRIKVRPSPEAWRIFWIEMSSLGLWQWPPIHRPGYDGVLYDGTQWQVAISHGGRHVKSEGRYATESREFTSFRRSLERLTGGMSFG
jgi:hypothetical protein